MAAERKRGCGFRKIGGLYLCADGPGEPCHRLPMPLEVCPTCHAGIKQTRGWTWVKPELLGGLCETTKAIRERDHIPIDMQIIERHHCEGCPVCTPKLLGDKAGLLWIGEQFYKEAKDFTWEAMTMGISRRITTIPRGFKVGEHWVLLAHPKAVRSWTQQIEIDRKPYELGVDVASDSGRPGIFHVFKPNRIEKVLADDTKPEEIRQWEERGCKIILLPHDDNDHRGTAYDDDGERSVLNLDEVRGML